MHGIIATFLSVASRHPHHTNRIKDNSHPYLVISLHARDVTKCARRRSIISKHFSTAYASGGQLSILHHSKGLDFKGNDKLESESVGDVFAASLGYSVEHPSNWAGLYVSSPFNTVNGAVVVLVDGIERVHVNDKAITYEVVGSGVQESFDSLLDRVRPAIDLDLTQGIDSVRVHF